MFDQNTLRGASRAGSVNDVGKIVATGEDLRRIGTGKSELARIVQNEQRPGAGEDLAAALRAVVGVQRKVSRSRLQDAEQGYNQVMGMIERQAALLSFVNAFWWAAVIVACLVPVPFLLKKPKPGDFRVQNDFGGTAQLADPPSHVLASAIRALQSVTPTLYARVDGVVDEGQFRLMELELIEPALFLADHPEAAERFAEAIAEAVAARLL